MSRPGFGLGSSGLYIQSYNRVCGGDYNFQIFSAAPRQKAGIYITAILMPEFVDI